MINRINSVSTQSQYNRYNNFKFKSKVNNKASELLKNRKKVIAIFSGPSGVGKGTILGSFRDLHPDFFTGSVSCCTRSPRVGEINGVHYNFLTVDEFNKGVENGEFIEHQEVYPGKSYGTRFVDIKKAFNNAKKHVMMEIDVDGARKAKTELEKEGYPVVRIFIKPDKIERLEQRLIDRGTETPETIKARVGRANYEVGCADEFDVIIQNNNDVKENVEDLNIIFKDTLKD